MTMHTLHQLLALAGALSPGLLVLAFVAGRHTEARRGADLEHLVRDRRKRTAARFPERRHGPRERRGA